MARGTKVDINQYITNIEAYLKAGCSLPEACLHGKTPYTTVKDYYDRDEEIRNRIERLKNEPILVARKSVLREIKKNGELALKFLERKKRDEFSTKTETELSGGITTTTNLTDEQLAAVVAGKK